MQGRRRTIQEFNTIEEYFRNLDVSSKVKTRKTEVLHSRCSVFDAHDDNGPTVQNIKVLAKKIKLIIEDGAEIKFSNVEEKIKEKIDIASTLKIEQKDKSQQPSNKTQSETKQILTEKVRAHIHQKNGTQDQWLKFLEDQDQSINDQLNFELSQVNQNQNTTFFIKEDSENFFDQKQTVWESQADLSDFWSFQMQREAQKNSVASDEIDAQTQNILQVLKASLEIPNADKW